MPPRNRASPDMTSIASSMKRSLDESGKSLERRRYVGSFQPFPDAGEQDEHHRKTDGSTHAEEQRLQEIVVLLEIEERYAEHSTIGRDKRKIDAQNLVQHGAHLSHHHFGELHDPGDDDDEGNRGQIGEIRAEQVFGDQVAASAAQGENESRRSAHANRRLEFLGNAHERAESE